MADRVRAAGAVPVVVLLRLPTEIVADSSSALRAARDSGIPVIDLQRAFPIDREGDLLVAPWDKHPNREGHRLLADRLLASLLELKLFPRTAAATGAAHIAGER